MRTRKNGTCRKEPGRSGTVADTDLGIDLRGAPPLRMAHSNTTTKTERRACPAQHSRKEPGRSGTGADTDLGNDCFAGGSSLGPWEWNTQRPRPNARRTRACRKHSEKELGRSDTVAGIAGTDLSTDLGIDSRGSSLEDGTRQHNDRDRTAGVDRRRACLPQHSGKEPGRPGTVSDTDLGNDSRLEHGRYSNSPV